MAKSHAIDIASLGRLAFSQQIGFNRNWKSWRGKTRLLPPCAGVKQKTFPFRIRDRGLKRKIIETNDTHGLIIETVHQPCNRHKKLRLRQLVPHADPPPPAKHPHAMREAALVAIQPALRLERLDVAVLAVVHCTADGERVDQELRARGDAVAVEGQVLRQHVLRDQRHHGSPVQDLLDQRADVREAGHVADGGETEGRGIVVTATAATGAKSVDLGAGGAEGGRVAQRGHDENVERHAGVVRPGGDGGDGEVHGVVVVAFVFRLRFQQHVAREARPGGSCVDGFPHRVPPFGEGLVVLFAHLHHWAAPEL